MSIQYSSRVVISVFIRSENGGKHEQKEGEAGHSSRKQDESKELSMHPSHARAVQWTGAGQQPVGEPARTRNQGDAEARIAWMGCLKLFSCTPDLSVIAKSCAGVGVEAADGWLQAA